MLQVLVDVLPGDLDHTLFHASVNAHVLLQLDLLAAEAHRSAVALVHLEEILGEQATFRPASGLKNFESAITLISVAFRQDNIDNLFSMLLQLLLKTFQLVQCDVPNILILIHIVPQLRILLDLLKQHLETLEHAHLLTILGHLFAHNFHFLLTLLFALLWLLSVGGEFHESGLHGLVFLVDSAQVVIEGAVARVCRGVETREILSKPAKAPSNHL